jgi:hypothetical protein
MTEIEIGAVNADDTGIHFIQTNNFVEKVLGDLKASKQLGFCLESCGLSSACCASEAVGAPWHFALPKIDGVQIFGQDDLLGFLIYSEYGLKHIPYTRRGIIETEVIDNIAWGLAQASAATPTIRVASSRDELLPRLDVALSRKSACVICYRTNYDNKHHYITVVKKNLTKSLYYAYDPWPENKHCKHGGILEPYTPDFIKTRARMAFMEVSYKARKL